MVKNFADSTSLRFQLKEYILRLIVNKELPGLTQADAQKLAMFLLPGTQGREAIAGPGRENERFSVGESGIAGYRKVGVPRIALDNFIRKGCTREAMTLQMPYIVKVPKGDPCKSEQVFNPKTGRCMGVRGKNGKITKAFKDAFPQYAETGSIPLKEQYPLQFTTPNWWTTIDQSASHIDAGRSKRVNAVFYKFQELYTCGDLRAKFKEVNNEPWTDQLSVERLQKIIPQYRLHEYGPNNASPATARPATARPATARPATARPATTPTVSSTPIPLSTKFKLEVRNRCPANKVRNPETNRCISKNGQVARQQGLGVFQNKNPSVKTNIKIENGSIPNIKPENSIRETTATTSGSRTVKSTTVLPGQKGKKKLMAMARREQKLRKK